MLSIQRSSQTTTINDNQATATNDNTPPKPPLDRQPAVAGKSIMDATNFGAPLQSYSVSLTTVDEEEKTAFDSIKSNAIRIDIHDENGIELTQPRSAQLGASSDVELLSTVESFLTELELPSPDLKSLQEKLEPVLAKLNEFETLAKEFKGHLETLQELNSTAQKLGLTIPNLDSMIAKVNDKLDKLLGGIETVKQLKNDIDNLGKSAQDAIADLKPELVKVALAGLKAPLEKIGELRSNMEAIIKSGRKLADKVTTCWDTIKAFFGCMKVSSGDPDTTDGSRG